MHVSTPLVRGGPPAPARVSGKKPWSMEARQRLVRPVSPAGPGLKSQVLRERLACKRGLKSYSILNAKAKQPSGRSLTWAAAIDRMSPVGGRSQAPGAALTINESLVQRLEDRRGLEPSALWSEGLT
jgi:hypothetical protein